MLLAIDVGNTNLTIGLYDGAELLETWRLETLHSRTEDEYGLLVRLLLEQGGYAVGDVGAVIVASVVPTVTRTVEAIARRTFHREALVVGPGIKTGMPILYDPPKDVGADRIVNAVAAFHRFHSACIVVDFGTATTFDSVTERGEYAGGAIAPGIQISTEALFSRAAKLPKVDIQRPRAVVGKNTVESMQSGILFGYAGLVDGLVRRMRAEMKAAPVQVVATGGLAELVAGESETIEAVDGALTLEGLRLIYDLNR
ncbi:MAG: type III pantothenate kinase [Deltaproteobacteria bacterium]|nr:type III pantothenate kinase [Deltaproteobacteria bacterium]